MKRTGSILVASCLLPTWVPDCYWFAEEYLKAALLMYCYHIVLILRITSLLPIADHKKLVRTLEDSCHPCRIRETGHTKHEEMHFTQHEKIWKAWTYHILIILSYLIWASVWASLLSGAARLSALPRGRTWLREARSTLRDHFRFQTDTAELYLEYVGICWNWIPSYKAELITSHVSNFFFPEWSRSWFLAGAATNLW